MATLSAALLSLRGVIDGAATLLGLGLGLSSFAGDVERVLLMNLVVELLTPFVLVPFVFVFAARRTDLQLEGGGMSFMARSAALRLVLGGTVGIFMFAIEIVSLRDRVLYPKFLSGRPGMGSDTSGTPN